MRKGGTVLYKVIGVLSLIVFTLIIVIYKLNFFPRSRQKAKLVCNTDRTWEGTPLKILSWNVQYFAGKNYVFFYDKLDGSGPDLRPSSKDIEQTLDEIANVIVSEDPDIVLLQEVDEGAKRTDHQNQTELLLQRLHDRYPCFAEAFYWKSKFVPHPKVMGSAGMKLVTLSKYQIHSAMRERLTQIPKDFISQAFDLKRAILEVMLPQKNGTAVRILNTHLDAFAQGTDTMEKQVHHVKQVLDREEVSAVIGGDFNLLSSKKAFHSLSQEEQSYYNPDSEIKELVEAYPSIPSLKDMESDPEKWFTHFPNGSRSSKPDRTIDYLFYKKMKVSESYVLQKEAIQWSDHFPVVGIFDVE
ncbi:MAG: hypothetical protein CL678_16315 [Bdellovibrionaceae bacterium]|nr:hypothetical protein [Pseudobdellovibrionaceae bacterium]|tara:strand:+ start:3850 stop:4917 length:1068 start_codon:yes stop_codon:yes gene_type:complete